MFSCEFCEISNNTLVTEHLWWLLLSLVISSLIRENSLYGGGTWYISLLGCSLYRLSCLRAHWLLLILPQALMTHFIVRGILHLQISIFCGSSKFFIKMSFKLLLSIVSKCFVNDHIKRKEEKRLWHRCFPVNFTKFLRTSIVTEHLWWLLLSLVLSSLIRVNSRYGGGIW